MAGGVVRNVVVRIGADISELIKGMQNAQKGISGLGKTLSNVGANMTKYISAPLAALGAGAVKSAADFEEGMSKVKSVSSATGEEMDKLKKLALKMGADTKYSAKEAANGIEELAKAGLTTSQILDGGLQGALSLAAAGEIDVGTAASIASIALNAFKSDNLKVSDAANLLSGAANASASDVMGLSQGLSQVSAVASGVGLPFKDTVDALAVFSQNGLLGADAGTSLKTMLLNLTPSSKEATSTMQELGIVTADGANVFYDSKGKLKGFSQISEILKQKLSGLTDQQRQLAFKTMFGTDAIRAANIMFKEGGKGADLMAEAIGKVDADSVAKTKMDNLNGSLEQFKGSVETLAIKIGELLLPIIKQWTDKLTELVNKFIEMSPETQRMILLIGGIALAVPAVLLALGGLSTAVSNVIGFFKIISAFSLPFTGIILGLTALGLAFVYLWNNNQEFKTNMLNLWETIKTSLSGIFNDIKIIAIAVWDGLKLFWSNWGDTITARFSGIWDGIKLIFSGAFKIIEGVFDIFAGIFSGNWSKVWEGIKTVFSGIWDGIKGIVETAWNAIGLAITLALGRVWDELLKPFFNWLGDIFKPIFTVISDVFTTAWDAIVKGATTTWDSVKNAMLTVYNWLHDTFKPIFDVIWEVFGVTLGLILLGVKTCWNAIKDDIMLPVYNWLYDTFKPIFDVIKSALETAWNTIVQTGKDVWTFLVDKIIMPVYTWLKDTFILVFNAVKNALTTAWDGITNTASTIWNGIKDSMLAVYNWLSDIFSPVFATVKNALSTAWDGIAGTVTGVWDGIKNAFKDGINQVIGFVNKFIDKANSISINIPKVSVPGMGDFGGYNIGMPQVANIPKLARGGIVDSPTIAQVGEAGAEAIIPLENTSFVDKLASAVGTAVMGAMQFGQQASQSAGELVVNLDSKEMARILLPSLNKEVYRIGNKAFIQSV